MLSQQLIGELGEDWTQPTLAALFADWWYLIILSLAVATALLWLMVQLAEAEREMRQAAAQGNGGEEAVAIPVYFRTRRRNIIRSILLLVMVLFFTAYPVAKSWYGLE